MYKWIERNLPWILLAVLIGISAAFWLTTVDMANLSAYRIFPILGLLAWEMMWVQCVVMMTTILGLRHSKNKHFKDFSEWSILPLIILHPGILAIQSFIDSGQLPPDSYLSYVGPDNAWAIVLGVLGLVIFLSYDLFKLLRKALRRRNMYKYVSVLQAIGMVAIFVHGLAIGSLMNTGFGYVWIVLGVVLVPCLTLYIMHEFRRSKTSPVAH